MTTFQVAWNPTTKDALIQSAGAATVASYTDIGDITETDPTVESTDSLVLYHHVRDLLYAEDVLNMQDVTISFNRVTGISTSPATATKAAAETQQLTNTFTPADASNKDVTYASSDVTKATVSASGLITAVATGEATITVTSVEGGFTDTCVLTIS